MPLHLDLPLPRALLVAGICVSLGLPARADDAAARIDALERKLESSARLIETLAARVAELERSARPAAVPAPAAAPSQQLATLQDTVDQLSSSMSQRSSRDPGLPVHGFADAGAAWSSRADPQRLRGFHGGLLDLYLTPQFGNRVKSLVELVFEYEAGEGLAVDLERLQLGYTVSDQLTLWAGRFHTPFGVWNTAYHHGANLQTSITRPRFIDFEDMGGLIPTHSIGLWATGSARLGSGRVHYDAYLANGPSIRERHLDFNPFTDDDSSKMVGFNVGWQPGGLGSGLNVGVHGLRSGAKAHDEHGAEFGRSRLRMLGGYAAYDADDWELIGEYYRFSNTEAATGVKRSSHAGFVQVGRSVGAWTPYLRFEEAALAGGDPFFAAQASGRPYRRGTAGLRFALGSRAALKVEFGRTVEQPVTLLGEDRAAVALGGARYRRLGVQYSVAF